MLRARGARAQNIKRVFAVSRGREQPLAAAAGVFFGGGVAVPCGFCGDVCCLSVGLSCRGLRLFRAAFLLRALARWAFFAIASRRRSPLGGQEGRPFGPPEKSNPT